MLFANTEEFKAINITLVQGREYVVADLLRMCGMHAPHEPQRGVYMHKRLRLFLDYNRGFTGCCFGTEAAQKTVRSHERTLHEFSREIIQDKLWCRSQYVCNSY